jgi:hypothetical protein
MELTAFLLLYQDLALTKSGSKFKYTAILVKRMRSLGYKRSPNSLTGVKDSCFGQKPIGRAIVGAVQRITGQKITDKRKLDPRQLTVKSSALAQLTDLQRSRLRTLGIIGSHAREVTPAQGTVVPNGDATLRALSTVSDALKPLSATDRQLVLKVVTNLLD